jgi:hypothetical protein
MEIKAAKKVYDGQSRFERSTVIEAMESKAAKKVM